MQQATGYPNQVGFSIFGSISAVINALATTVVTLALKANTLVDKTSNVLINTVGAAEVITEAGEKRAKIYSENIVKNGELAEREGQLKMVLRLRALEAQELATRAKEAAPIKEATTKANGKDKSKEQPAVQATV